MTGTSEHPRAGDVELAITAMKKGAHLLKYGRRGKPKFCPFKLANDESALVWLSGTKEKHLKLRHVCRVISGQQTPVFLRFPRPEKEDQSFSLICDDRSLDLICRDKKQAQVWLTGLKALIPSSRQQRERVESRYPRLSFETSSWGTNSQRISFSSFTAGSYEDSQKDGLDSVAAYDGPPKASSGKGLTDITSGVSETHSWGSDEKTGTVINALRVSMSCAATHGSGDDDIDELGDVYVWGEGTGVDTLGGEMNRSGGGDTKVDSLVPKPLESAIPLNVQMVACGREHATLVTKHGDVFSWGKELKGRLGHGINKDFSQPKLVDGLKGIGFGVVACGEYHSCAVTHSGDMYIWGDCGYNARPNELGKEGSQWVPKWLIGPFDGLHVSSVSCGPWHTAVVTSSGKLFTFGDGSFGVLGHGDCQSTVKPREVESLRGLRTMRAACGVWHTAAVVEVSVGSARSITCSPTKIFTWGDGEGGHLGHPGKEAKLVPTCVAALIEPNFCQVACGHSLTVALTTSGQVYTMGSPKHGQLGNSETNGKLPILVKGKLAELFVKEVACGANHVAILTSGGEVYTWGKGSNGQLGHGDSNDKKFPSLVEALKDKQVKSIVCGTNFTAAVCLHKWPAGSDQTMCYGCNQLFNFKRKRHNCYNCGLAFCHSCSSKKSTEASMAPNADKPYRVCDKCFFKLKEAIDHYHEVKRNENLSTLPFELQRCSSADSCRNSYGGSSKTGNYSYASFPVSRSSRAKLPDLQQSSPPHTLKPAEHHSMHAIPKNVVVHTSNVCTTEVVKLRAQLKEQTQKSQLQQLELDRMTTQMKEALAAAAEENAKYQAAKKALKSLAAQCKDTAQRLPIRATINNSESSCVSAATLRDVNPASFERQRSHSSTTSNGPGLEHSSGSVISYVSGTAVNRDSNLSEAHREVETRAKKRTGEVPGDEWVEKYETGVYITLACLPGGAKGLKRVQFSRNWFTEREAEQWWATNKARLYQEYQKPAVGSL